MDRDIGNDPVMDMFVFETFQLVDQLEQLVLQSEKANTFDTAEINEIFRIMHTIKGSAAMMLFNNISAIAHAMEDLFFNLRETELLEMNYSKLCDLVLGGIDFIKVETAKIKAGQDADGIPDQLLDNIHEYLTSLKPGEESANLEESPPATIQLDICVEENCYKAVIFFEDDCEMENMRAFNVIHKIEDIATLIQYFPDDITENDDSSLVIRESGFEVEFATHRRKEEIENFFLGLAFVKSIEIFELAGDQEEKVNYTEGNGYKTVIFFEDDCGMENMRAFNIIHKIEDIARLTRYFPDDITENDDSSLVIRETGFEVDYITSRSREEIEKFFLGLAFVKSIEILEVAEEREEKVKGSSAVVESNNSEIAGKDTVVNSIAAKKQSIISVQLNKLDKLLDLVGELVISEAMVTKNPDLSSIQDLENFSKAARQHHKVINELQDIVMSIRMVPLAGTFQKMNRIVRDMCKKLNKQVELVIAGEETEVDKNIIEHLSDPIMHLIRNAIDHGIEPVEERIASGKPAVGKIHLEAKNEGGDVWITIRDDGGGLNREKILQRALEHGLVNKMETELSDQEIYGFILLPGFSTKQEVTEFSGRGVGMDVVAQNLEEIGGLVNVDSKPDIGTTISLKIPLTLAIIDGMGISVGKSIYIVPITSIRESFKAKENEVFMDPDGMEMIMVRGECLPILRLHKIYKIETPVREIHNGIIMIVENDNRSVCLFADELIGEQQVVVKALPRYLKKVKGIGGCTLLGDGRSSLILDIAGVVNY